MKIGVDIKMQIPTVCNWKKFFTEEIVSIIMPMFRIANAITYLFFSLHHIIMNFGVNNIIIILSIFFAKIETSYLSYLDIKYINI